MAVLGRPAACADDGRQAIVTAESDRASRRRILPARRMEFLRRTRRQSSATDLAAIGDSEKQTIRCSGGDAVLVVEPALHRPAAHDARWRGTGRRQPAGASRRLHAKSAMWPAVVVA